MVVLTYFTLSFHLHLYKLYFILTFLFIEEVCFRLKKMCKDTSLKAEVKATKFVWEDPPIPPARGLFLEASGNYQAR